MSGKMRPALLKQILVAQRRLGERLFRNHHNRQRQGSPDGSIR